MVQMFPPVVSDFRAVQPQPLEAWQPADLCQIRIGGGGARQLDGYHIKKKVLTEQS